MLLIALALACSALMGYLFAGPDQRPDAAADKLGPAGRDRRRRAAGARHAS